MEDNKNIQGQPQVIIAYGLNNIGCDQRGATFQTVVGMNDEPSHSTGSEQKTDEGPCLAESNVIFNSRILTTEAHYRKVRVVILRFIKKDGVTSDVEQINPSAQNEWYYIMKGIRESGMASSSMGDTKFAEQMVAWYPDLFADKIGEGESKDFVRNFAKSISAERNNYWTEGVEKTEIAIIDMHAHARTRNIDSGKAKRAFGIANGLKKALEELKTEIQKTQSAKR